MKTLKFQGYSDDTFGEYGVTNDDCDNCANGKPIHCLITADDGAMFVTGLYSVNPIGGVWTIGISQLDEDVKIPAWPIRFTTSDTGYSPVLEIDVPDGFSLKWFIGDEEKESEE